MSSSSSEDKGEKVCLFCQEVSLDDFFLSECDVTSSGAECNARTCAFEFLVRSPTAANATARPSLRSVRS